MALTEKFAGLMRGQDGQVDSVVTGTSSTSTLNVEIRVQTDDGTAVTGITRSEVARLLDTIARFYEQGGLNHAGANLPVL